MDKTQQCLTLE